MSERDRDAAIAKLAEWQRDIFWLLYQHRVISYQSASEKAKEATAIAAEFSQPKETVE